MSLNKTLKLKGVDYFKVHINIVNALLDTPLTKSEVKVLAHIMLKGDLSQKSLSEIRSSLNMSAPGWSNFIRALVKKKCLIKSTDDTGKTVFTISRSLLTDPGSQEYKISIFNEKN